MSFMQRFVTTTVSKRLFTASSSSSRFCLRNTSKLTWRHDAWKRNYTTYRRFDQGSTFGQSAPPFLRNVRRPPNGVLYIAGGCGLYYVWHLERVEETGRLRFMDVGEGQEIALGNQAEKETLQEYRGRILPQSHPTTQRVSRVAHRLLHASGLNTPEKSRGVHWKVYVIDDPDIPNAMVLPNGSIFVFTGILPICQTDDGIAAVIGHEIAHKVARHSGEKLSSVKVLSVLSLALQTMGLDLGFSRLLLHFLVSLPNSRTAETEADHIGLFIMSKACYDGKEAANMWKRMQQKEKNSSVDFTSTHPGNEKRVTNIEQWLPEANAEREKYCGYRDDFASLRRFM